MLIILNTLWLIWEIKFILFWLYLWQLKEYHVGRFIDHFRTDKGRKLIFSLEQISKFVLFIFLLLNKDLYSVIFYVAVLLYLTEAILFIRAIVRKSFKKPVFTFKILCLTFISIITLSLFSYNILNQLDYIQISGILLFDIFTPLIISTIVLICQPFFVMIRKRKLLKAQKKMERIKSGGHLKVIAITGSYGKTSTKEFMTAFLSAKYNVLSTRDHQNSEIGVAECILNNLNSEHEYFIAEVGAYNRGKVTEVCRMIKPDYGVVSGVNEQHLSLFGSMENLLLAEGGGEMADVLPEKGILFLNGENKYCLDLFKKSTNKFKQIYALDDKKINADTWADDITVHKDYISFIAKNKYGEMAHFHANVLGKQNVQNLLGAILVAREMGMSFGEISDACKKIKTEHAGMILKKGKHDLEIIDSSYSANPDGVLADLVYLSIFPQKKVIIMPCLIELGNKSSEIHKRIGEKIAQVCDMAIITSKDKFEDIKRGAMEAGMSEKSILLCDNVNDIYCATTAFAKSGDAILLEGRVPAELLNLLVK